MVNMLKPSDGIKKAVDGVKNIIKASGEISAEKHSCNILVSREHGTMSLILQTKPKIGISVRLSDIEDVLTQLNGETKIHIKNQLNNGSIIEFCLGEKEFELGHDEIVTVEVKDEDCLYLDIIKTNTD